MELECIRTGQKRALKTLILDYDILYRIIDSIQCDIEGLRGFHNKDMMFDVSFNPFGIGLWITENKVKRHYTIVGNGDIIKHKDIGVDS